MKSLLEQMGGTYTLGEDGIYYPDLVLPTEEMPRYGKYGRMRKAYLEEYRRGEYMAYLVSGTLINHLNEIDVVAQEMMILLIDEGLKAYDQIAWVGAMNDIHNSAEEIVLSEFIYR